MAQVITCPGTPSMTFQIIMMVVFSVLALSLVIMVVMVVWVTITDVIEDRQQEKELQTIRERRRGGNQ